MINRFKGATNNRFLDIPQDIDQPFYFICLADSQIGMNPDIDQHSLRRIVTYINSLVTLPKFVIICGDLVQHHVAVDQPSYDPHKAHIEVIQVKSILEKLKQTIQIICIPGNHDVGNIPYKHSIQLYNHRFGDDYYYLKVGNSYFIMLNSTLYKGEESRTAEIQDMAATQDSWLTTTIDRIAATSADNVIVFIHHLPFVTTTDESNSYWNIPLGSRLQLLSKLERAKCSKIFCGHWHKNNSKFTNNGQIELITTAPPWVGFRIVAMHKDKIRERFIPLNRMVDGFNPLSILD